MSLVTKHAGFPAHNKFPADSVIVLLFKNNLNLNLDFTIDNVKKHDVINFIPKILCCIFNLPKIIIWNYTESYQKVL